MSEEKIKKASHVGRRCVKEPAPDANVLIANTMTAAKKKEKPVVVQRIKYYREKKGMEQKALAKEIGVGGNAVSNWERGRSRPDIALLPKICAALEVTMDELFDMPVKENQQTDEETENTDLNQNIGKIDRILTERYHQLSVAHQFVVDAMICKLIEAEDMEIYNQVEEVTEFSKALAAGFDPGEEFDDKGEIVYMFKDKLHPHMDCVFSVSGDSMEPKFHDGDKVLVQRYPDCGILEPGEIGAFITRNEAYIKIYQKDGLHSLNKKYKTMKFTDDDKVYIIGKVLGVLDPDAVLSYEDSVRYENAKKRIEARMSEEQEV